MCFFKQPKIEPEKVPPAPALPEDPPQPPEIGTSDLAGSRKRGRNSLRIDLAGAGNTSVGPTGLRM